jgi:hypothetical protein
MKPVWSFLDPRGRCQPPPSGVRNLRNVRYSRNEIVASGCDGAAPPRTNIAAVPIMSDEELKLPNQICVDCSAKAPPTETNYTLISSRYGWRLSLQSNPDGRRVSVWRCPSCWDRFRRRR